jgi:pilus assembly protein CpaC
VLQGATIPAFRQRYVETAVEMNAGQTFAIAGLLQNRTEATMKATPFFGELPIGGSLFRRISEQNNEIELLITVTPELAEAMDPDQVPAGGPGLNTDSPTDKELFMRGYIEVPRTDDHVLLLELLTQTVLLPFRWETTVTLLLGWSRILSGPD